MNDNVVIERRPNVAGQHRVYFQGKEVCVVYDLTHHWFPREHYHILLDRDKELVNEHVDEFICMLQITNRMTS